MKTVFKSPALLLLLGFVFCIFCAGCNKPEDKFTPANERTDRLSRMSVQERKDTAPNELFQAVLVGDLEAVKAVVGQDAGLMNRTNPKNQNTPLGLAIELRERAIADYLADQMLMSDYFHLNGDGNSYIYLAAKTGYTEIIEMLATRYFDSFGTAGELLLWDFVSLDQPNKINQRALHVAADRRTAEVLSTQYWKGSNNIPYWSFSLHIDDLGQSFLHTAAADGRTDILLWGAEQFCDPSAWEKNSGWFGLKGLMGTLGSRLVKIPQMIVGDFGAYLALLFNRVDNNRKTAMHRAIEARNLDSVRAVGHCRWLNYGIKDDKGNIPLQMALLQVPAQTLHTADAERAIFDFVLHKDNPVWRWFYSHASFLNSKNKDGQTSAHLAARLADPYFFEKIATEADIYQLDLQNQTPQSLFDQRQNLVKQYGR